MALDMGQDAMAPRRERLLGNLTRALSAEIGQDGSEVLPDEATAEPGVLLHELYEVWQDQVRTHGSEAHSLKNLENWIGERGEAIRSLQHKLKGRLPFSLDKKEELERLVTVFFDHWDSKSERDSEKPVRLPLIDQLKFGSSEQAARKLVSLLYGPIYTLDRAKINVIPSPGISTAKFMEQQAHKLAILLPVMDRAMYGSDPARALAGTRLSLTRCLRTDHEVHVIWLLRGEMLRDTLDYIQYLYERSFLATLFQLLKVDANEFHGLAPWKSLKARLFVCIAPAREVSISTEYDSSGLSMLVVDDFLPQRAPQLWNSEQGIDFKDYGFAVTATDTGKKPSLTYWKHTKPLPNRSDGSHSVPDIPAFSLLRANTEATMKQAHQTIITAVQQKKLTGKSSDKNELRFLEGKGWKIVSADEFIAGEDLDGPQRHKN